MKLKLLVAGIYCFLFFNIHAAQLGEENPSLRTVVNPLAAGTGLNADTSATINTIDNPLYASTGYPKEHDSKTRRERVSEMHEKKLPSCSSQGTLVVLNSLKDKPTKAEELPSSLDVTIVENITVAASSTSQYSTIQLQGLSKEYNSYTEELAAVNEYLRDVDNQEDVITSLIPGFSLILYRLMPENTLVQHLKNKMLKTQNHCLVNTFSWVILPLFLGLSQSLFTLARDNNCDEICLYILPSNKRLTLLAGWMISQVYTGWFRYFEFQKNYNLVDLKALKSITNTKLIAWSITLSSLLQTASQLYIFTTAMRNEFSTSTTNFFAVCAFFQYFTNNYINFNTLKNRIGAYVTAGKTKAIKYKREMILKSLREAKNRAIFEDVGKPIRGIGFTEPIEMLQLAKETKFSIRPFVSRIIGLGIASIASYIGYKISEHAFKGIYMGLSSKNVFIGYDEVDNALAVAIDKTGPNTFGYIGGGLGGISTFVLSSLTTADFLNRITGDIWLYNPTNIRLGQANIIGNLINLFISSWSAYFLMLPSLINGYIALKENNFTSFMTVSLIIYGVSEFAKYFNQAMDENSRVGCVLNEGFTNCGCFKSYNINQKNFMASLSLDRQVSIIENAKDEFIEALYEQMKKIKN